MKQREIKFRVWDKKFGSMYYDGICVYADGSFDVQLFDEEDPIEVSESEHGEILLMQYTGAKDQSGREVYEGDIVRYVDGRTGREVVAWVEWTKGMFRIHGPLGWTGFNINEDTVRFEVIGNLYENHDTQFMQ